MSAVFNSFPLGDLLLLEMSIRIFNVVVSCYVQHSIPLTNFLMHPPSDVISPTKGKRVYIGYWCATGTAYSDGRRFAAANFGPP